ncbi:hypothetical protein BE04_28590 [Sorangium cellulosum]|uniref:Uncharacterized protein n=2 Tax=Sorangium cellulosum TaxID=56 RepID=A0A150PD91_SORCE|nr:hypothetical protein [Sorangium cellulosum]AGP40065.1 hypothetical protein SCE1572_39550 [Sorangium cellulosum So0157-2]KYF53661.1 hypothetical protein BE04_28590 [Sorangium cellulosum]
MKVRLVIKVEGRTTKHSSVESQGLERSVEMPVPPVVGLQIAVAGAKRPVGDVWYDADSERYVAELAMTDDDKSEPLPAWLKEMKKSRWKTASGKARNTAVDMVNMGPQDE